MCLDCDLAFFIISLRVSTQQYALPNFCKNISLAVLIGSKVHSYTMSMQSDMCLYTHTLYYKNTNWDSSECCMKKKNLFARNFGHTYHKFASTALDQWFSMWATVSKFLRGHRKMTL